jgi:chemotaxis protein CheD
MKTECTVNIGELVALRGRTANIVCRGLGSCIGLFIYDRSNDVVGAAHVFLPGKWNNHDINQTCFSTNAVDELVAQMKQLGSRTETMEAKLVGGASVVALTGLKTGEENAESVAQALRAYDIDIKAMEVGGNFSRIARFASDTLEVTVTSRQNKTYQVTI